MNHTPSEIALQRLDYIYEQEKARILGLAKAYPQTTAEEYDELYALKVQVEISERRNLELLVRLEKAENGAYHNGWGVLPYSPLSNYTCRVRQLEKAFGALEVNLMAIIFGGRQLEDCQRMEVGKGYTYPITPEELENSMFYWAGSSNVIKRNLEKLKGLSIIKEKFFADHPNPSYAVDTNTVERWMESIAEFDKQEELAAD